MSHSQCLEVRRSPERMRGSGGVVLGECQRDLSFSFSVRQNGEGDLRTAAFRWYHCFNNRLPYFFLSNKVLESGYDCPADEMGNLPQRRQLQQFSTPAHPSVVYHFPDHCIRHGARARQEHPGRRPVPTDPILPRSFQAQACTALR